MPEKTQLAEQPKRKRHLGLFTLLLLLLVGLAFAAGYLFKDSQNEATSNTGRASQTTAPTATQKTAQTTDIVGMLTKISSAVNGGAVLHDRAAPDYTVAGYNFAAQGDATDSSGITVSVAPTALNTTTTKLENTLTEAGFKKSGTQIPDAYTELIKYENHDTICGISNNKPEVTDTDTKNIYLYCALKNTYSKTAEVQKPFYTAYRASKPEFSNMSVGYPRISDSLSRGYKTAQAALYGEAQNGGAMGLFYQTPGGEWKFFKGTQQGLPCSDYNTIELKKAFMGEQCYTGDTLNTLSSVQP